MRKRPFGLSLPFLLIAAPLFLIIALTPNEHATAQESPPVCFWAPGGPQPVDRGLQPRGDEDLGERLLSMLLAGPTPSEIEAGIWTAIPKGTTSAGIEEKSDDTLTVRLNVPADALTTLDHEQFEVIVNQIGRTMEYVGWRNLYVEAVNPTTGEFVALADFLPEIPAPRKPTVQSNDGTVVEPRYVGQPPAPGQGQPLGSLTGKTVYVSAGHGWEWECYRRDSSGNCLAARWQVQRIPYPRPPYDGPIIEDHNNAEVVNQYLLQYLWNAGGLAWPARERDMNGYERIIDNDSPGSGASYNQSGNWSNRSGGYDGGSYRAATTVTGAPTASAEWSTTLPSDGRYAVYAWYYPDDNAGTAHYTVHHAGGSTNITIDQRRHGVTWTYLGTYGFLAGQPARVTLTNQSDTAGKTVVADAVRFGGGTFDDLEGIGTTAQYPPDEPWYEVAAFYYTQKMGMDRPYGDVTARPIYARWEHAGTGEDAVYVSWHSNGWRGTTRGTETYIHNGEGLPRTSGSADLAQAIHTEVINDIRAGWDPQWTDRGVKQKNLGELRLLWDNDESVRMPGALLELAFHDNPEDTDALKEPAFEMLAARAVYQGIVKYFEQRDGVDLTLLPEPPQNPAVRNVGGGSVEVTWERSPTDGGDLLGDPATGYRVYTSTNGIGWSDGVAVGNTTSHTLTGLPEDELLFVRVTATNGGGESFGTETAAVRVGDRSDVLLVNGFDRLNRTMRVPDYYAPTGNEENMRMLLDRMNRYDYVIQHGEAISRAFDSASNEAVESGRVLLSDYAVVDWILGEESAPDQTLSSNERAKLSGYLTNGGALFISGSEIGWDLDYLQTDRTFYNSILKAEYTADDAGTYAVNPVGGSIFDGLGSFRFDAPGMYDVDYPDVIAPVNGAQAGLNYDSGGTAAVVYENGCERLVHFGFPFETIEPGARQNVMDRVMGFLDACIAPPVNTLINLPEETAAYSTPPTFDGTAEAFGASIERVEVQLERVDDGLLWDGTDWNTASIWDTATGTDEWTYAVSGLATDGTDDGRYTLWARARTTTGAVDDSPASVTFFYDTQPPAATSLITPTGGVTVVGTPQLEWEPVDDPGSPISYEIVVDGISFSTDETTFTPNLSSVGPHTWGVRAMDRAGNASGWATDGFFLKRFKLYLPFVTRDYKSPEGEDPAPTPIPTPTPTPEPEPTVLDNGSFETDIGWQLNHLAIYDTERSHSGNRSARTGIPLDRQGSYSFSSIAQTFEVPQGSTVTLKMWVYDASGGEGGDYHYVAFSEEGSSKVVTLDSWYADDPVGWEQKSFDLTAQAGGTITLYIGTRNDGNIENAVMYVDDVSVDVQP